MSLAIIDAREWQNMFDLRTGQKTEADSPLIRIAKQTLAHHAYPGDVDPKSNAWVTDTALELVANYQPQFAFLAYAQYFFTNRYEPMTGAQRNEMLTGLFKEVDRFVKESGFTPVIIGNGDMIPIQGIMDLSRLDGLAVSTNWSARYVGLYAPSERDWEYIRKLDHLERIVPKQEFLELFGGAEVDLERLADYLLVAKEGHTFKTAGTTLRRALTITGHSFSIPVSTPLGRVTDITGIRPLIEKRLPETKVALIMVEGVGPKDLPWPHALCNNSKDWFYYEPSDSQYLTLTTGTHQMLDNPTGSRYWTDFNETKEYPFSGFFREIPANTLGNQFTGRSIAVGNRSMFMHMAVGADISVEC
ncbi:MAG: hypothetical protein EHM45_17715, partial [Desulfobacteraceae bacterium]